MRITPDSAGVESWAPAFRDITRTAVFGDTVAILPLERSAATDAPNVPVVINGKTKRFWLDTGSSISILSSDVAKECNVTSLGRDTLQLLTSVGRLPARPALVRSLRVGAYRIIYQLADNEHTVRVAAIRHRSIAYDTDPR